MSSVPVMINGVLWDHATKSGRAVTLMGEATIAGLGVGGGPIYPPGSPPGIWGPTDPRPGWGLPGGGGDGGSPPGIWGPTDPRPGWGLPGGGGGSPPGIWGPTDPRPGWGLPGGGGGGISPVPPDLPNVPPPGSPPVIIPGTTPTHPITPPPAIVVDYPGIGKVVVPQPVPSTTPPPTAQPKK